jgi:hypothetical protein
VAINPSSFFLLKAGSRYLARNFFPAIELRQALADRRMDGFLAFLKQVFLVVEQLNGSLDKLLDTLIAAAFDIFLDQLL